MGKSKRMIVISLDAMGSIDFEAAAQLPNFKKFLRHASYSSQVSSIYPSLTYPAHVSIVTGRRPCNHGVINNTLIQPKRQSPDWCWQRKYVSGTTLYDEALKRGMKVAALLWPVTARSKITWNMPEIFANRPWTNQILTSVANGTPLYQLDLNQKFGSLRNGKHQPELDNFTDAAMTDTLRTHQPDLMLVHLTDLDSQRHEHGVYSKEAKEALVRHDVRLGHLMETLRECGMDIEKDTTVVLLGDHSQMDVHETILLNRIFAERGYQTVKDGQITDWKVFGKHCDGSAYVYIKKTLSGDERARLKEEVGTLLRSMEKESGSGILAVYSGVEAGEMGADPSCDFMLEAEDGFYFQDEQSVEAIREVQHATHGYRPDRKNYQTVFMIAGPDICKGIDIGEMSLLDEGPTMAALMGFSLPKAEGRILEEII